MSNTPHDPDFERSVSGSNAWSFLDNLTPKSALTVGLVGGIMALCTIGFVVMAALLANGNLSYSKSGGSGNAAVQAPVAVVPPAGAPVGEAPSGPVPPLTAADHVRGDASAPLTLIEYSDLECPFCQRFHPTVARLLEEFKGKVKWVYRHYPLSFHANAQKESEASECAAELGGDKAFWEYVDKIFERSTVGGTGFSLDQLAPLARELGLNETKFKQCLDSGRFAQKVQDQLNSGASAGIQGTPGSFLIGKDGSAQLISGAVPYEQLKAAVEAKLR